MWLIPTRGRPEACRALIGSMEAAGEVPEAAVMIDDDPALYRDVAWPAHWHVYVAPEHLEMTRALNRLVELHPDRPFYGILADHARPRTPGWASTLEREAGAWNIAYSGDGWLHGRQAARPWLPSPGGATVVGGELVRRLGWLFLPETKHLFADYALAALGDRYGLLRYRPDVLVPAERPDTTGSHADANYRRLHNGVDYAAADLAAYEAFLPTVPSYAGVLGRYIETPVVIACTKGPHHTAEQINILADMVRRALPESYGYRFVCFTDEPEGLDVSIERAFPTVPWPFSRLEAFAPGSFAPGLRIVYLDPDLVIAGPLDPLVAYRGPLTIAGGSSVMLWRAGDRPEIWETFAAVDCPATGTAADWLAHRGALRIDDVAPGSIRTYDAAMKDASPEGVAVVLFDAQKPADFTEGWVADAYRIGGTIRAEINLAPNTPDHTMMTNVRASCARGLPHMVLQDERPDAHAVIVGGGASLADTLDEIRWRKALGQTVFALNGAGRYLAENGIACDAQIILDARPSNARFVASGLCDRIFVSATCDPAVIDAALAAAPGGVTLYFPAIRNIEAHVPDEMKPISLIGGGITVGLTAMALAYTLGYRQMHLYGYDSSLRGGAQHAYRQDRTDGEAREIEVIAAGRTFTTVPAMLRQAQGFVDLANALADLGCTIDVRGDGLLPHMARDMARQIAVAEAAAA